MLDEIFILLDWHLITILCVCVEQHPIFERLPSLDLALIDSVVRILCHDNREICNSLKEACSNIKVPIAARPSPEELYNIEFHIAL